MNGPLEGLPHSFCKLQDPNKYKNVQTDKTFFCRNMKNERMSFLSPCNVEITSDALKIVPITVVKHY